MIRRKYHLDISHIYITEGSSYFQFVGIARDCGTFGGSHFPSTIQVGKREQNQSFLDYGLT